MASPDDPTIMPGSIDPATGQPIGGFWGAPEPQGPGAPLPVPAPPPRPVNNKFGGFDVSQGPGVPAIPDPTGPALPAAGTAAGTAAPAFPIPTPGGADSAIIEPPAQFPIPTPGGADQPLYIPQTTTESSTTTSGPTKETVAKIEGTTEEANKGTTAAGQAKIDELNATAELERKQSRDAYARGVNNYFQRWGEINTQDQILTETAKRLEEAANFQPDRTALFHGDNGAMFGISSAIAAMAGGWLMGQGLTGGRNPYLDVVMRMIEQNAQDQIESNSRTYQVLRERLGDAKAAKKELKARMLEDTEQTLQAQARFEKSELVQKGVAAVQAEVQREIAKNRLESAKLTAQSTSNTVNQSTKMVLNPAATGGIDVSDPKEYTQTGRVMGMVNLLKDAQSLADNGTLSANVGFLDEAGNWVKEKFNARDPGQAKVDAIINQYKSIMYEAFKTEPNGEMARELASIGVPRNDEEVPLFLESIRRAINVADPGGRYRQAGRALGQKPNDQVTSPGGGIPIVRIK